MPVEWKGRDGVDVNVQEVIAIIGGFEIEEEDNKAEEEKEEDFETDEPMNDNAADAQSVNTHEVIVALV